jgi:MFS family permease
MSHDDNTRAKRQAEPPSASDESVSATPKGQEVKPGFLSSLRTVLTYRSYSVYLVTSWILGIFGIIVDSYLLLYLRDLLLDYILIGIIVAVYMAMDMGTRFLGGYVGDNYNRKWLSVLTMLISAIGFFVFAFAGNVLWIFLASFILALSSLFASGSTSYIYENIPVEHSGLAIGIFQTSSAFGLIGLGLVTWLLGWGTTFVTAIQLLFLVGGVCYTVAAVIRIIFLAPPKPISHQNRSANKVSDFLHQNATAVKLLVAILPVFLGVLLLDAFSDGFYRFVSMFYLNEALAFSIGEISLMLIVVLAVSIPLSIVVGGFFDRHGSRWAILIVYSVMPVCLALLILAPVFPYWLPTEVVAQLAAAYPILEPLLSTAFLATAFKGINDILWWTLILTYLRRAIPRSETAKMLSIFFIITMIANIATPIPAAYIYTYLGAFPVLSVTFVFNLIIVGILVFGNIEAKPAPGYSEEKPPVMDS